MGKRCWRFEKGWGLPEGGKSLTALVTSCPNVITKWKKILIAQAGWRL